MKFRLVKKSSNPTIKNAPTKWYAVPSSHDTVTVAELSKDAARNTTLNAKEIQMALASVMESAADHLIRGHTVNLGELGNLRISFKSQGEDDVTQFTATKDISNPRIVFRPSNEFRKTVIDGLTFENSGVLGEDGIPYATISGYLKSVGQSTGSDTKADGGSTSQGGSTGGGTSSGNDDDLNV